MNAIFFDLDGTLVDTEPVAIQVTQSYFHARNLLVKDSDLEALIGRPWAHGLASLIKSYPLPGSPAAIEEEVLQDYRRALARSVPEIPGSRRLFGELAKHFPIGVVSNSRRSDIEFVLKSFGVLSSVTHIVGIEDVKSGKPSPDPYLKALSLFGFLPKDILVFEDSASGVLSAHAAGLTVVAVGNDPGGELPRPKTRWHVPDLTGVDLTWVRASLNSLK